MGNFLDVQPLWAVNNLSSGGWSAGTGVSRTILLALSAAGENVVLFGGQPSDTTSVPVIPRPVMRPFFGQNTFCRILGLPLLDDFSGVLRCAGVDALVPVVVPLKFRSPPSVGWIPDFQHRHLPQLFSNAQLKALDERFEALARSCRVMWLTSQDAAADFQLFFPQFSDKIRIAPFPSLFAFEPPTGDPRSLLSTYRVPGKFILVVNQFWGHKNHLTVARALGILACRGIHLPTVMVGMPSDYRDRENSPLSITLQELASSGAWANCTILGKVSREMIIALLRCATLVVQPSRFEGWNTTVEDAKALGCPVILSDLDVHHEQCPNALGFFDCDDPQALAEILVANWEKLPTRPDFEGEEIALLEAKKKGLAFGIRMREICQEACS
jgi:glycosyltransferase involved in cell wall biosynthesis